MDEQKDMVNKLRKAFRDNKGKMAAANSDNRGGKDNNQAGNAMNHKKSLAPERGSGHTSVHARVETRTRRVGSKGAVPSHKRPIGRSDLDMHANTCIAGATHKALERTGQFCE
eukprot:15338455-Ditylum_brightwellii.AAC.1